MAITEHESGSASLTLDTIDVLNGTSPETTDGVFQLFLDVSAMLAGDVLIARVREKCRSGDTQRLLFAFTLAHAQAEPLWCTPPVLLMHGWDMEIEQTDGTARTIPWSIRKIA